MLEIRQHLSADTRLRLQSKLVEIQISAPRSWTSKFQILHAVLSPSRNPEKTDSSPTRVHFGTSVLQFASLSLDKHALPALLLLS